MSNKGRNAIYHHAMRERSSNPRDGGVGAARGGEGRGERAGRDESIVDAVTIIAGHCAKIFIPRPTPANDPDQV